MKVSELLKLSKEELIDIIIEQTYNPASSKEDVINLKKKLIDVNTEVELAKVNVITNSRRINSDRSCRNCRRHDFNMGMCGYENVFVSFEYAKECRHYKGQY